MKPHLIILGAGRARGDGKPLGLQQVTLEKRVLDWQLDAFSSLEPDVGFVGGYDIAQVMQHFPSLTYHFNQRWQETASAASLALALNALEDLDQGQRDLYISYSDILLRPTLIESLAQSSSRFISLAVDVMPTHLDIKPPETIAMAGVDYEFVGLVRVPAPLTQRFRAAVLNIAEQADKFHLSTLFANLAAKCTDLQGSPVLASKQWGHAEHARSVAQFVLGSKAATLERLSKRLSLSQILPLSYFTRAEYLKAREQVIAQLCQRFKTEEFLIVRSSATDEDGFANANAGRYHSELHVNANASAIGAAIDRVFNSYSGIDPADEVLVQPQLSGVQASGVVFTRVLETGAPYRVLNYSVGPDTTAITNGTSRNALMQYVYRYADAATLRQLPVLTQRLLAVVDEIEGCVCHDALDIEFAVDSAEQIFTLQVRPLMVDDEFQDRSHDEEIDNCLKAVGEAIDQLASCPPKQVGLSTVWSVMADWNPAEIVGVTPGPLALDLYRHIITDNIWAMQRHQVGYRDVRGYPLIRSFAGQAYVDVRASINSFIPATLNDSTAKQLAEFALARLREDTTLHDKLEFELMPTCLDFGFLQWKKKFIDSNTCSTQQTLELEEGLRLVTRNIVNRARADLESTASLYARCDALEQSFEPLSDWLRYVLNICAQEGALTFAHLARAGFVAASLLRSAVGQGLLKEQRVAQLMESIPSLGRMLTQDAWDVKNGRFSRQAFIKKYGHLRPGTYDISTPAYRDKPTEYLDPIIESAQDVKSLTFEWTQQEYYDLNVALKPLNIGLDAASLLTFVHTATIGREYAKFVFTRLLSSAIDMLAQRGRVAGVRENHLESMPLNAWLESSVLAWSNVTRQKQLIEQTEQRHKQHRIAGLMMLPPVIVSKADILAYVVHASNPTYITVRQVSAPLRLIQPGQLVKRSDVENCVVAITNADPGYDYLFALGINGLITGYGGPNSHMAIRASEFSIPAVIGVGEQVLDKFREDRLIEIDCLKKCWRQEGWTCA